MPEQYARALYDFAGAEEGDLSFKEDEVIFVVEQDESGWWIGEHQETGIRGEFPYNYVELISQEEAERIQRLNEAPKTFAFKGDRVDSVRVVSSEASGRSRKLKFQFEVRTQAKKKRTAKKTMPQIRELDAQVRAILPAFKEPLPPAWADQAALDKIDVVKREEAVERYLNALTNEEAGAFLLLIWLFPGERVEVQAASTELTAAGKETMRAGQDRASVRPPSGRAAEDRPTLAFVEFTWTPQDDAELFMEEGQIIAILAQDTGSPGWWMGQTAAGDSALLPFNHVELLDSRVSDAVLSGTSLEKAQQMKFDDARGGGYADTSRDKKKSVRKSMARISLGIFGGGSSGGGGGSSAAASKSPAAAALSDRQRKVHSPFQLGSIESFDRLVDNGFTMEENGRSVGTSQARDGPQPGDFVQLNYGAYLWNEQKESIVEFAATDLPSKLAPEGGLMEFFVGGGEVIKGVEFAVQRMSLGQTVRVVITPQLAFGKVGLPPDVPPNSHIVFDLTLEAFGSDGKPLPQAEPEMMDAVPPPPPMAADEPVSRSPKPPRPTTPKPVKPAEPRAPFERQASAASSYASSNGGGSYSRQAAPPASRPPAAPQPPGGGKPMTLQEAIAVRRQKLEQQPAAMRTAVVGDHVSHRGLGQQQQMRKPAPPQQQRQAPQKKYLKPDGQFSLRELQDAVRAKKLPELGIDPAELESYLDDEAFNRAFKMTRDKFILLPKWKRQAAKRGVGLF